MTSCSVNTPPITLNRDLYFEENTVQPNDLHVILKELKRIPQIKSIKRNIFDGRQIATYIYADFSD
ncbi:hypothetical protein M9Y10_041893 [Tritrichomonas musculus]|uniref:Uncharacterized protein n=1 Tax=Tritrichomonas musculus TaxID=1915356 RepID=A0ABR2K8R0_9EUKA